MTTVSGAIVVPEFLQHLVGNALADEAAISGKKEENVVTTPQSSKARRQDESHLLSSHKTIR
jgi:hypothetical protein